MTRRKGVPCGCGDDKGCCSLREKLRILWDRTIGSIIKINNITPDGDGNFRIESGTNISVSDAGNGIRIDTTGGVSYYTSDDPRVVIDNDDLKISLNDVAKDSDLDTVAQGVLSNADQIAYIVDGTTLVGRANVANSAQDASHATTADSATNATNASNIVSSSTSIGDATHPVYVQNGQAVAMSDAVVTASGLGSYQVIAETSTYHIYSFGPFVAVNVYNLAVTPGTIYQIPVTVPKARCYCSGPLCGYNASGWTGLLEIDAGTTFIRVNSLTANIVFGWMIYLKE